MLYAKITTQFEGIHFWKDAKGDESFLKYPHRHIFFVTIKIEQYHNDREIEFIAFKRWISKFITDKKLNHKSCEMIAEEISKKIKKRYPGRKIIVEVSEDNENGCILES